VPTVRASQLGVTVLATRSTRDNDDGSDRHIYLSIYIYIYNDTGSDDESRAAAAARVAGRAAAADSEELVPAREARVHDRNLYTTTNK